MDADLRRLIEQLPRYDLLHCNDMGEDYMSRCYVVAKPTNGGEELLAGRHQWIRLDELQAVLVQGKQPAASEGTQLAVEIEHGTNQAVVGGTRGSDGDPVSSSVRTHEHKRLQQRTDYEADGRAQTPTIEPPHEHHFSDFTLCRHCLRTEADVTNSCHHCDEGDDVRCWWCLRPRTVIHTSEQPAAPEQGPTECSMCRRSIAECGPFAASNDERFHICGDCTRLLANFFGQPLPGPSEEQNKTS